MISYKMLSDGACVYKQWVRGECVNRVSSDGDDWVRVFSAPWQPWGDYMCGPG